MTRVCMTRQNFGLSAYITSEEIAFYAINVSSTRKDNAQVNDFSRFQAILSIRILTASVEHKSDPESPFLANAPLRAKA